MKAAADSKKTAAPAAEAAATTVLEGSEMGEVKIHENVIASLVRRAALSIEGVSRLAGSTLVDIIAEIVGSRRMQARAITVDMAENNRVSVEIKLNIKAGYNVPQVATAVQKAVIEEIEKTTGMTVLKVNVVVQEIDDPVLEDPEEEETEGSAPVLPLN